MSCSTLLATIRGNKSMPSPPSLQLLTLQRSDGTAPDAVHRAMGVSVSGREDSVIDFAGGNSDFGDNRSHIVLTGAVIDKARSQCKLAIDGSVR
jgi:hypothetical protein